MPRPSQPGDNCPSPSRSAIFSASFKAARSTSCARAAANLDLAPAGLSPLRRQNTFVREKLDPAAAILRLIVAKVEADDFEAAQAACEAQKAHGTVAQTAQGAGVERFQHGEKIDEEDGFPLTGRGGCLLPIASGEPSGEMPVLRVERLTALRKVPGSATTGGCRWSTPTCCPSAEPEGLGLERPAVCGSGGCGSND